uniref:Uncharacterized protein n=1 Tax=Vespula pensylvanica TaxID=30213 RepID=A0A834UB53_VESPE|nr:hypothetical protein H0235_007001 [Vespula pensylvanica]
MGLPARDTSERRNKNEPRKGISKVQDMDLIEVLWKQDVDLGFTLVEPTSTSCKKKVASTSDKESEDEIEKLKALEAINATNQKKRHVIFQWKGTSGLASPIRLLEIVVQGLARFGGWTGRAFKKSIREPMKREDELTSVG